MESRFYDAITAKAFCDSGKFVLYGRRLRPFCFLHSVQLDALQSPIWLHGVAEDESDLQLAALICSEDKPVVDFSTEGLEPMPFDVAFDVWVKYMAVSASKPMVMQRTKNSLGTVYKAPLELLIVTYLSRKTNLTPDEIWTMPVGMAHWYLEATREQEDGDSWILTEEEAEEMDRLSSPEGKAAAAKRDEQARRIVEVVGAVGATISTQEEKRDLSLKLEKLLCASAKGELAEDWEATWQT